MVAEPQVLQAIRARLARALAEVAPRTVAALYAGHRRRLRYDELALAADLPEPLQAALRAPPSPVALMAALDASLGHIRKIPPLLALLAQPDVALSPPAAQLVDAWTYGLLLDRVTAACVGCPAGLDAVRRHLAEQRRQRPWHRHDRYFLTLKLASMLAPMRHITRAVGGQAQPGARRLWAALALNIVEACAVDALSGDGANARAGLALLRTPYRGAHIDRGALHMGFEHPKAWADRYTVWNLRFVRRFPAFLKVAAVLLLPSVLAYTDAPTAFVHRRSVALFQHVHFAAFCYADGHRLDHEPKAPTALRAALRHPSLAQPAPGWSRSRG